MQNEYGLDVSYFESKLTQVMRDINCYKPEEMARELFRLAKTANKNIVLESDFLSDIRSDDDHNAALSAFDNLAVKIEAYEQKRWPIDKPTKAQAEELRADQSMSGFVSQLPQKYWDAYIKKHPTSNELAGAAFVRTFCDFVADGIHSLPEAD